MQKIQLPTELFASKNIVWWAFWAWGFYSLLSRIKSLSLHYLITLCYICLMMVKCLKHTVKRDILTGPCSWNVAAWRGVHNVILFFLLGSESNYSEIYYSYSWYLLHCGCFDIQNAHRCLLSFLFLETNKITETIFKF